MTKSFLRYEFKGGKVVKKKIISVLLILTMMLSLSTPSFAATEAFTDTESYAYPIQPGTVQWAAFDTKAEKLNLLQIPEDKLSSMTTQALLVTVLNYPYILDYHAFNTKRAAFDTFYEDFNGFRALMERDNLTEVLLSQYCNTEVIIKAQNSLNRNTSEVIKFFSTSTMEFLIICDQIKNGDYSPEQVQELNAIASEKLFERERSGLYSEVSNVYKQYIYEQNMSVQLNTSNVMPRYGEIGTISSVKTPKGSIVDTLYNRSPEMSTTEKGDFNLIYDSVYPNASRLEPPTVKYNCHSYAWYSQTISNLQWMDDPSKYMSDGSYYLYTTSPRTGMRAFWPTGNHSGIISKITSEGEVIFFM